MGLPSFSSPSYVISNYSIFGVDLNINPVNDISCNSAVYTNDQGHSAVTQTFLVYNADVVNNITRTGQFADGDSGIATSYFEFMYDPGINVINPIDFVRVEVIWEKEFVGPVGPSNPIQKKIRVRTQQTGIVFEYPAYTIDQFSTQESVIMINVGNNSGSGSADVNISWNDIINGEFFIYTINNYPFDAVTAPDWRYHSRLNLESTTIFNHIEDFTDLDVQEAIIPESIVSGEAFGNTTIVAPLPPEILPTGIESGEEFGIPFLSTNNHYVIVGSIVSEEFVSTPDISRVTTGQSALGQPSVPLQGDIRLILDDFRGYGEMILSDRDVERDAGLETEALIVLGTERLATKDDPLPYEDSDLRGWWGDLVPFTPNVIIGTKLWLLKRSKITANLPARAKEYVEEGFQYWIDDGIASEINVDVQIVIEQQKTIKISIEAVRPDNTSIFFKYFFNWENQILRSAANAV